MIREGRPCATSVAKLLSLGKNPAEYATCSKPISGQDSEERSVGCGLYKVCEWRDGPRNKGVRIFKKLDSGDAMRQCVMACHEVIQLRTQIESNGGYVEVIAEEGEKILIRGSVRIQADAAKGETSPREEDRTDIEMVVPEYPRDEKHPALKLGNTMAQLAAQRELEKREKVREGFLGKPEPDGTPAEVGSHSSRQPDGGKSKT